MRFIRKNGRVIPIQDRGGKARATVMAAGGAAAIVGGSVKAISGAREARKHFRSTMSKISETVHIGQLLGMDSKAYKAQKAMTVFHSRNAIHHYAKASKKAYIGAAIAGAGTFLLASGIKKLRDYKNKK